MTICLFSLVTAVLNEIVSVKFDLSTTLESKSCHCLVAQLACYTAVAQHGFEFNV